MAVAAASAEAETMTPSTAPASAAAAVLLSDGSIGVIRPIVPGDRDALDALHQDVSDTSFLMRFFALGRKVGHDYADHLMSATEGATTALVATVHDRIVAVASTESLSADTAEVAFLVADSEHGHGVGSLLLEHLAAAARKRGIRVFVAEVRRDNHAMLGVFTDAGFAMTRTTEADLVHVEMLTEETFGAISAADERESRAEARSLARVLAPHSIAVVGVRRDGSGIGQAIVDSIREGGFTGDLAVVHPDARALHGVTAYRRLDEVPKPLDLVVLAVPAERILSSMAEIAATGAAGVVVISSGFSELGEAGRTIQHELLRMARDAGIRLIGPNCLGIVVNDPAIRLNATFTRNRPPYGGLAIASQSGGIGIALLDLATDLELGVHAFISLGNKADVSGNDLLAAWLHDPAVTAAALYLESFGNAAKFTRVARRFAAHKPLLAVVGGRSSGGRRAGASHTAAAATPGTGVDALFAQAGVIACHGAEDMAEAALLLAEQPLPGGRRLAIVTNAGGMGVLAADTADDLGLEVPQLSASVQAVIADHVSGTVGLGNPVDLGAGGSAANLETCLDTVLGSGEVDALLVVLVPTQISDPGPFLEALAAARSRSPELPVLLTVAGGSELGPRDVAGVTAFRSYDAAAHALARAASYAAWLRTPSEPAPERDAVRAAGSAAFAQRSMAQEPGQEWLTAEAGETLLHPYGLAQTGRVVRDGTEAGRIAGELGFPTAVKVADPAVQHKTDRGLVRIGLRSADEVAEAVQAFAVEMGRDDVPVLVQPMVSGVELALGVVRDPVFGPLIRIAAGGIATNLWKDQVFLLPPLSRRDAEKALRGLRIWPLLTGYRGSAPLAVGEVVDLIVSLAQLAIDVPELSELDLNPLIVTTTAAVVVDAKVCLRATGASAIGGPRQLSGQ